MKKTLRLSFVLLGLSSLGGGAKAQVAAPAAQFPTPPWSAKAAKPADWQRLDQLLQDYTTTGRVPGAIALLLRDGKVVYRKAFGLEEVAAKTPLRPDAIVRIASQTKAVTSVGLMLLYDEGKFQLDDPIAKYLPAFANAKVLATFNAQDSTYTTTPARSQITIRQLLTHTSGISYPVIGTKEAQAIYAKAGIPSGIGPPQGRLAAAMDRLGSLPLLHEPGARWTYGLSVDVLGRLIEVLSGQPLDQFLRHRLFEPLAMRDTYFYLPAGKASRLAHLYTEDPATKTTVLMRPQGGLSPDYPKAAGTYFSGGAGLSSTIDDYATFLEMLRQGGLFRGQRLLKPETVALMTQNQIGELNQGRNKFGLGFSITTAQSAHAPGLSPGSYEWGGIFGTAYWVDPKEKLVALIYTQKYPNTTGNDLDDKFKVAVYEALNQGAGRQ